MKSDREFLSEDWPEFASKRDPLELQTMDPLQRAAVDSRDLINHKLEHVLKVAVASYNLQVEARNNQGARWTTAKTIAAFFAAGASQIVISLIVNVLTKT